MDSYKILWVDDEIDLLTPHVRILDKKGYHTSTVNNGDDAIAMAAQGSFDLILLDVMMPGKDGIRVLEELKSSQPNIPVVMITKSEDDNMIDASIALKAEDFLVKPLQPRQLLAVCKRILEGKRLVEANFPPRYAREVQLLRELFANQNWNSWIEAALKLFSWSNQLSESTDSALKDIHGEMKKEADEEFSHYFEKNYPDLIHSEQAPVFSHTFFKRIVKPLLDSGEKVLWVILDCMRADQWFEISRHLQNDFEIATNYYFSIIPSATPYSRNALFNGKLPREIVKQYPDFLNILEKPHQNRFEKDFLYSSLRSVTKQPEKISSYRKIINVEGELNFLEEIQSLKQKQLIGVVVDFIDLLSHSISRHVVLEEMIRNEISLKKITGTWFLNSPLFKALKLAKDMGMKIIITTDHGSIKVKTPAILKNARSDVSSNLRYKYGSYLDVQKNHQNRCIILTKPEQWGLPKHTPNTNYVFAIHDTFLVYPTNPEVYTKQYRDTIQHGGVSLEEVVIPYAVCSPR